MWKKKRPVNSVGLDRTGMKLDTMFKASTGEYKHRLEERDHRAAWKWEKNL